MGNMNEFFTRAKVGGVFDVYIHNKATGETREHERAENLVPTTGLNYVVNGAFGQTAQISTWYVGELGNYTPVPGTTMTHIAANEVTAYDEATREVYTPNAAATTGSISNSSSPATFTCSTNSTSVYGLFLCSSSTKGGSTGTLLAAALFASAKSLDDGEELVCTYTFGAADDEL